VFKRRAQDKTRPLSHGAAGPSPTFNIENPLFQKLTLSPLPDGVRVSQLGDGSQHAVADTLRYEIGAGGATYAAVNGPDRRVNGEWGQLYSTAGALHSVVRVGWDATYDTGDAASETEGKDHSAAIKRLEQPWTPTYDLVDRPDDTHAGSATDPASRA
jgi:hypothetical protein